jgi:hypothetical protein
MTPSTVVAPVVSVAGALAVLLAATPLVDGPRMVPRLLIRNPTVYDLTVEVTDAHHDGWMAVWIARRNATTVAEEIVDVGDTWVFRFRAQGETTRELRVARDDLERSGWRLSIPTVIGDELRARGAPRPP